MIMTQPRELLVRPIWAAHDSTVSGRRTWAAEVSANLICNGCTNLGTFTFPEISSDEVVADAEHAVSGAADLALVAANDHCTRDCSIKVVFI